MNKFVFIIALFLLSTTHALSLRERIERELNNKVRKTEKQSKRQNMKKQKDSRKRQKKS